MENRSCQLNVPKMTRAFLLAFFTGLAIPLTIDGTQTRIIKTLCSRSLPLVVLFTVSADPSQMNRKKKKNTKEKANHCLWVFDMDDTHPFDLLRRKETKLNFLDRAQRRLGVWEENVRHDGRFLFFFFFFWRKLSRQSSRRKRTVNGSARRT